MVIYGNSPSPSRSESRRELCKETIRFESKVFSNLMILWDNPTSKLVLTVNRMTAYHKAQTLYLEQILVHSGNAHFSEECGLAYKHGEP